MIYENLSSSYKINTKLYTVCCPTAQDVHQQALLLVPSRHECIFFGRKIRGYLGC